MKLCGAHAVGEELDALSAGFWSAKRRGSHNARSYEGFERDAAAVVEVVLKYVEL